MLYPPFMANITGKRVALVKIALSKRTVDALEPTGTAWIAWDDKLTGFGVRVYPSGRKSFIVNYRAGDGGRRAPNKRIVLGRCDRISADQARRMAHQVLGKVAGGDDPADERADARGMPVLREAFEEYMAANPNRAPSTDKGYRAFVDRYLGDWLNRPLDTITRREIEARFNRISTHQDWASANRTISILRSVYSRPCVDPADRFLTPLLEPEDLYAQLARQKLHRLVTQKPQNDLTLARHRPSLAKSQRACRQSLAWGKRGRAKLARIYHRPINSNFLLKIIGHVPVLLGHFD